MSMTPERAGEIGKEYLDRCMGNGGVTPSEKFLKRRALIGITNQIAGLIEQRKHSPAEPQPDTFANLSSPLGELLVAHHPARTTSEVNSDLWQQYLDNVDDR